MKIIEAKRKSKLGFIGFAHTVILDNKGKIWSWEYLLPFISKGKFIITSKKEFEKNIQGDRIETTIKSFDITKYKNLRLRGMNCSEVIDSIMRENNIGFLVPLQSYVYKKLAKAILLIILLIGMFIGGFVYGYYGFTITEQEYQQLN